MASGGGVADWEASVAWTMVPECVTWRLVSRSGEVRFLKIYELGQHVPLSYECDRMVWAASRLSVPRVIDYGCDDEYEWLQTAGMDGISAVDEGLRSEPARLVPLLGEGLRRFHSIRWEDCPFHRLPTAEERKVLGAPPEPEDLVVTHGDYCVPNVIIRDWRVAGYVDLGALGVADRWYDLAVGVWSVKRNMGPGWEDAFLEAYGVKRGPKLVAYYRLLYDMEP